jgi:CBS domain containing-hemolysin-like protein
VILAASGWKSIDGVLLAVIVLLLAGSGVLALAETSLVRTSRVKARSLADQHRRGSRPLVRRSSGPSGS